MGVRGLAAAGTAMAAVAALAPTAQGRGLGSTAWPLDATEVSCPGFVNVVGYQTEAGSSWTVPNRGVLTSWSTNVAAADPGRSASIVILRRAGADLTIAAVDTAVLPASPPGGIATFRPAARIDLQPGDRLGIAATSRATCGWTDGAIPSGRQAAIGEATPGIAPGATLTEYIAPTPASQINLAAEVLEATDVRVAAAAAPANVVAGGLASLSATVANAGPASTAVTVTDTVPAGLTIETAVAGGGSCGVAGQQVTCEIPSLASGASVPVVVLVTPAAPGTFVNAVAAEPELEAAPADNAASATLTAVRPPEGRERIVVVPAEPRCFVPALTRAPLAVARGLLRQLDCRVGNVTRQRSARVPRGAVIATKPGRGTYRVGTVVRVVVSSGRPPRKPARRARAPARR